MYNYLLFNTITSWLVQFAIVYFVLTFLRRDSEGFLSAYRAALTIVLVVVLVMLVPRLWGFADFLIHTTQDSRKIAAQAHKVSASDLQAGYLRTRIFSANAGLRCKQAERDWDYVCSYMPTPFQSKARLDFGVMVDETHVLKTSRPVPAGTNLPSPQ